MAETVELARWTAGLRLQDIPPPVLHEAKRSLVNIMAVTLGGARHPAVDKTLAMAQDLGTAGPCSVLGRGERLDPLQAALANGIASHVLDFDDTHVPTILHPSGPVLSCVLALAELGDNVSGAAMLAAFTAGIEVGCRAALSVFPEHYDDGWHISGTAGAIGAAAAGAHALGLAPGPAAHALSLGATQAAGVQEQFGAMAKSFHVGRAAQSGILAALLARQGFTASTSGLEGVLGWRRAATSGRAHYEQLTAELGKRWKILHNTYKPFPCGVVTHPVIDGSLRLRRRGLAVSDIGRIDLEVHPRVPVLCGKPNPANGLEAKFSAAHCCAVALVDGAVAPAQFEDERVLAPAVAGLRRHITLHARPELEIDQARIVVTLRSGERLAEEVDHALGTIENPMTDGDLDRKFLSLAAPVLSADRASALLVSLWRVEEAPSLRDLLALARPAAVA